MKKIIKITIVVTITVVCTIIVLSMFGGFILGIFHAASRHEEQRQVKAQIEISALETALKLYKLDNGNYPTTEQGFLALVEKPTSDPVPGKWQEGGYLEKGKIPKDPWDREYIYLCPGINGDFDIISYGGDGAPGGEGKDMDIKNWELE